MFFILLIVIMGGLIVQFFQKYILKIKDPNIKDLWLELNEQEWYNTLLKSEKIKEFIQLSKENGLLSDPHYVRKIIDREGHREGFIKYINEKVDR